MKHYHSLTVCSIPKVQDLLVKVLNGAELGKSINGDEAAALGQQCRISSNTI